MPQPPLAAMKVKAVAAQRAHGVPEDQRAHAGAGAGVSVGHQEPLLNRLLALWRAQQPAAAAAARAAGAKNARPQHRTGMLLIGGDDEADHRRAAPAG